MELIARAESLMLRIPPRAADPYSTHLPVLAVLSSICPVRSVVEFGAGRHSTRLFLDVGVFPELQRLVSFENDREWFLTLSKELPPDPRLRLREVVGPMWEVVRVADLDGYDLVFIDDSQDERHRCDTIRELARRCPRGPLVVIHDFEIPSYRAAARAFERRVRITAVNPNVGILWNGTAEPVRVLKRVNGLLRRHLHEISHSLAPEWRNLALEEFRGRG